MPESQSLCTGPALEPHNACNKCCPDSTEQPFPLAASGQNQVCLTAHSGPSRDYQELPAPLSIPATATQTAARGSVFFSLSHKGLGVSYCEILSGKQRGAAAPYRHDQRRLGYNRLAERPNLAMRDTFGFVRQAVLCIATLARVNFRF